MGSVSARQHPAARIGGRIGAGLVLIGAALLVAAQILPLAAARGPWSGPLLTALGRLLVAAGAVTAVLAALLGRRPPLPAAAIRQDRHLEDDGSAARPADLGAAPEAIRDILAAVRQRGYEVATVAAGSEPLVVHMTSPLAPEDRQALIQQFPTLGRWYFSGGAHRPSDEGFRDALSGAAIRFPVRITSP